MTDKMREDFEAEAAAMGFDLTRQYLAVPEPWAEYVNEQTGYFWAGYQAATLKATLAERERCATEATALAEYAATQYAGGYAVNFEQVVGNLIRNGLPPTGTEGNHD